MDKLKLEKLLCDQVDHILGKQGLAYEVPGLAYNLQQHDYALRVARGLSRQDDSGRAALTALEAATGTGKTIGYLVPLLLYVAVTGERGIISTHARYLQRQILESDAALAQKWVNALTGASIKLARRVGRCNFVSITQALYLRDIFEEKNPSDERVEILNAIHDWALNEHTSGIIDDFFMENGFDARPEGLDDARLGLSYAIGEDDHKYKKHVAESFNADVLVINHALLALHAIHWSKILDADKQATVLIVDEVDRLPDVVADMCRVDIPLHPLCLLLDRVAETFSAQSIAQAGKDLYEYAKGLRQDNDLLALPAGDVRLNQLVEAVMSCVGKLLPTQKKAIRALEESDKSFMEVDKDLLRDFVDRLDGLQQFANAIKDAKQGAAFISWSPVREYPSLVMGRPDAGKMLSRLWRDNPNPEERERSRAFKAAVFTSATLGVPGGTVLESFKPTLDKLGVIPYRANGQTEEIHLLHTSLCARYAPTSFGKLDFVLADPRVVSPTIRSEDDSNGNTNEEWLDYAADIIRAAHAAGGRTMALTLSHRDSAGLADRLTDLQDNLLVQRRGTKLAELEPTYRENPRAVMVTPGAWEGVNLPGLIQQLVITRLPFTTLDTVDQNILREELRQKGYREDRILKILLKEMHDRSRRRLAQGIGRGIRRASDQVTLWIADPRFPLPADVDASLDPVVVQALPHRKNRALLEAIPERFMESYQMAHIYLGQEKKVYRPLVM